MTAAVSFSAMTRSSVLLAAVTGTPASTEEIYQRLGYATLVQLGLIPYEEFRAELGRLAAAGLLESLPGSDGSTQWRRVPPSPPVA
jgi:hypothetical protein